MLCARECPDWCIYIEAHKYLAPPRREGGKPRQKNALDRFDIDFSLCMYCGICVEVCPFEALFWSPEFEYSEPRIAELLHDKIAPGRVDGDGARLRALRGRVRAEGQEGAELMLAQLWVAENIAFGLIAAIMVVAAIRVVTTKQHRARRPVPGAGAGRGGRPVHPAGRRVRGHHPGAGLHRRHRGAVPVRHHADPGADGGRCTTLDNEQRLVGGGHLGRCCSGSWATRSGRPSATSSSPDHPRCRPPSRSPTRSSATYLIPFEVVSVAAAGRAHRRHRPGQAGLMLLNQFLLLGAVLFCIGRLRRAGPTQRRHGAHVGRADPQRRQHQPGRLRRLPPRHRRARCSPCSSSPSPPPRSASAWPWC